jgi:hypothetical protein
MPKFSFPHFLQIGLLLIAPFLIGFMLVMLGIGAYLWIEEPNRLPLVKGEQGLLLMAHQPLKVLPTETNVLIFDPPITAYISGAGSGAIWVNGKSFTSGGPAQWELLRTAWRLWLVCAATAVCGGFLKRYFQRPARMPR